MTLKHLSIFFTEKGAKCLNTKNPLYYEFIQQWSLVCTKFYIVVISFFQRFVFKTDLKVWIFFSECVVFFAIATSLKITDGYLHKSVSFVVKK